MTNNQNTEQLLSCRYCGSKLIENRIEPHSHALAVNLPDYNGETFIECSGCSLVMLKADYTRANPEAKEGVFYLRRVDPITYDKLAEKEVYGVPTYILIEDDKSYVWPLPHKYKPKAR